MSAFRLLNSMPGPLAHVFVFCCMSGIAPVGQASELSSSQLMLVERLGIHHPDQIVHFEHSGEAKPFYVTEDDNIVVHHQRLSDGRVAVRVKGGLLANETRRFHM